MTDEQAKAIQEVAKTSGQLVETTQKVGGFVSKVIGGASDQIGKILEDWAKFYRYKNLLRIADKVEAIHAQRKLNGKNIPIPMRTAIPMLEGAALEDDEKLQDIWAKLIANSTDPNFKEAIHPGYIDIIKQLSSDEAVILNAFQKQEGYPVLFENTAIEVQTRSRLIARLIQEQQPFDGVFTKFSEFCDSLSLKRPTDLQIYLDNLERLNVIELQDDLPRRLADSGQATYSGSIKVGHTESMKMTAFGKGFVEACIS